MSPYPFGHDSFNLPIPVPNLFINKIYWKKNVVVDNKTGISTVYLMYFLFSKKSDSNFILSLKVKQVLNKRKKSVNNEAVEHVVIYEGKKMDLFDKLLL